MAKDRVMLGMSGGIDSTAACKILLAQGYEVAGLTILTCDASLKAAEEAAELASRFGIEHYVADVRERFKQTVIESFVRTYLSGKTPNPCVDCNPTIKFKVLEEYADKTGCKYLATGHYARLEYDDGKIFVCSGKDSGKDQSYFLWRLTQEQLKRVIFPLGDWLKSDVRNHLKDSGFEKKADDGESMEICFFSGDYRDFLRKTVQNLDEIAKPGFFVDSEGRKLGEHKGYPFYTVGQRKGLNIALGYPAYVLKTNPQKNTVMLGDVTQLLAHCMIIEPPVWVGEEPCDNLTVRIRYRSKPISCCILQELPDGCRLVRFEQPVSAVTPGQSAVFYVGNRVVGGAYIASQRGINQWLADKK